MFCCYLSHIGIEDTDFQVFLFHEQPASDVVRGCMLEDTKVGIDTAQYLLWLREVQQGNLLLYALQGVARHVRPVMSDITAQELDTMMYLAYLQLSHVKVQPKCFFQETLYLGNQRQQPFLVVRYYYAVVHIPSVVLAFQLAFHKLVEWV